MNNDQVSEEIKEYLNLIPGWMTMWGSTIIFFLVCIILILSYLIKYPDIIYGQIILTTTTPPLKLTTPIHGKIVFLTDKDSVSKGEIIMEIENPLTSDGVLKLNEIISATDQLFTDSKVSLPELTNQITFGNLQPHYNSLVQLALDFKKFKDNNERNNQINSTILKIQNHKKLKSSITKEIEIFNKELENAKEKFRVDKSLYETGAISKMDYFKEESIYNQKQLNLEKLIKEKIQIELLLGEFEYQLSQLQFEIENQNNEYIEKIRLKIKEIQNAIKEWQQKFTITAPSNGKITRLKHLTTNQFIEANQPVIAILNNNKDYLGILHTPSFGFGKVKYNQKVRIKLDSYPFNEFGFITGYIKDINEISNQNMHRIEVHLPSGLYTSRNILINYAPEMSGVGEIVTDDIRVLDRIFFSFKKLLGREPKYTVRPINSSLNNSEN